jgi:hypothetical protein
VYLGKDTKMSLNQKSPPSKFSLLGTSRSAVFSLSLSLEGTAERQLNWTVLIIAFILVSIIVALAAGSVVWRVRKFPPLFVPIV